MGQAKTGASCKSPVSNLMCSSHNGSGENWCKLLSSQFSAFPSPSLNLLSYSMKVEPIEVKQLDLGPQFSKEKINDMRYENAK